MTNKQITIVLCLFDERLKWLLLYFCCQILTRILLRVLCAFSVLLLLATLNIFATKKVLTLGSSQRKLSTFLSTDIESATTERLLFLSPKIREISNVYLPKIQIRKQHRHSSHKKQATLNQ